MVIHRHRAAPAGALGRIALKAVNLLWRGVGLLLLLFALAIISLPRWLPVTAVNQYLAEITAPHLGAALEFQALDWQWSDGPALALRGVSIGDRAHFESLELVFGWETLTGESLRRVTIADSEIDLPAWQQWIAEQSRQPNSAAEGRSLFSIGRFRFRNLVVTPLSDYLGAFKGDIQFQHNWQLVRADLQAAGLDLGVQPGRQGYTLQVEGRSWQLPASATRPGFNLGSIDLLVDWQPLADQPEGRLHLSGTIGKAETTALPFPIEKVAIDTAIEQRELTLNNLVVTALGGQISANGTGQLDKQAAMELELDLSGLGLESLAQHYGWLPLAGIMSATATADLARIDHEFDWQISGEAQVNGFGMAGLMVDLVNSPLMLDRHGVDFSNLDFHGYNGVVSAELALRWANSLTLKGQALADQVALGPLMKDLELTPITGRLDGEAKFNWQAGEAGFAGLYLAGHWELYDGFLPGVDLKALKTLTTKGGKVDEGTAFDTAQSSLTIDDGQILLSDIEIKSAVVAASGDLVIGADQQLRGEIQVGGNERLGVTRIPVEVAGSLTEPSLKPTRSSLVGGAVGSAVLGPGLGTAVGIKVGEGLNNLRKKVTGTE